MSITQRAAVGLVLVLTLAGAGAAAEKATIAALPFRDSSPGQQYAPLAEAMGDLLVSYLSQSPEFVFVERSHLEKVLAEQELSLSGAIDPATQVKVGRLVGARYLLFGGLTVLNKQLRVNAHVFEVTTTRVARSHQATGKVDDLDDLVAAVARKLARKPDLKLPKLKKDQIDKSPQANLHFMRGLGYYYSNLLDHAIVEFMRCLNLKPDHARARYWNGMAYDKDKAYAHARIEFNRLVKDHPKHPLAGKARERLAACIAQTQKSRAADGK